MDCWSCELDKLDKHINDIPLYKGMFLINVHVFIIPGKNQSDYALYAYHEKGDKAYYYATENHENDATEIEIAEMEKRISRDYRVVRKKRM